MRCATGHATFDQVFTRAEMAVVVAALSTAPLERTRAGARHLLKTPIVGELSRDPRLMNIARDFVGATAVPFRATLFDKSPNANWLIVWHQDTALPLRQRVEHSDWGPWSRKAGVLYAHAPAPALASVVALRVSLDDSSATNGPLRVIPESHTRGILTGDEMQCLARERQTVSCVAASGGVVAMRPLIVHASSKSIDDRPRRVLHIEYAECMTLDSGLELAVA